MDPKIENALRGLRELYYSGKRGKKFGVVDYKALGMEIQDPRCVGLKEDLSAHMVASFFCDMVCGRGKWFKRKYRLPNENSYTLYISKETFSTLFENQWYYDVLIVFPELFNEKWYREN